MAASHGYPIIPLASVGAEDCYDIRLDRNDLAALHTLNVAVNPIGTMVAKTPANCPAGASVAAPLKAFCQ